TLLLYRPRPLELLAIAVNDLFSTTPDGLREIVRAVFAAGTAAGRRRRWQSGRHRWSGGESGRCARSWPRPFGGPRSPRGRPLRPKAAHSASRSPGRAPRSRREKMFGVRFATMSATRRTLLRAAFPYQAGFVRTAS